MDIYRFPDSCAPIIGDEKTTGWNNCSNDCMGKCKKCVPNLDTECGKEVSGSGIRCVPKSCFKDCCLPKKKKDKNTSLNDYDTDSDDDLEDSDDDLEDENFPDHRSYRVFIPVAIIAVFIIVLFLVYILHR